MQNAQPICGDAAVLVMFPGPGQARTYPAPIYYIDNHRLLEAIALGTVGCATQAMC